MLRYFILLIIITASAVGLETPDITLLTYDDNLISHTYCIAGPNVDSGLYFAGPITKNVSEYGNFLKEIPLNNNKYLNEDDSSHIVFNPIIDKRWQKFPSIFTEDEKFTVLDDNVVFSVRSDGPTYIYINNYTRITIENHKTVKHEQYYDLTWNIEKEYKIEIKLSNENWLHIGISKYKSSIHIYDKIYKIRLDFDIKGIQIGSTSLAEWKIQKFKYWEIKQITHNVDDITFQIELYSNTTYVAAYVLLCNTCILNMAIVDNDENIVANSKIQSDGETWQKIQLDLPSSIIESNKYYLQMGTEAKYELKKDNFWWFSHLHYCNNDEFRILSKSRINNKRYVCATLNGDRINFAPKSLSTYNCTNNSVGKYCQIDCRKLSEYFDNVCNKSIICDGFNNGISKCYCPSWSYEKGCRDIKNYGERSIKSDKDTILSENISVANDDNKPNEEIVQAQSETEIIHVYLQSGYGIIIIIGITSAVILTILLIIIIIYLIYKKKKASNESQYDLRPLLGDILKESCYSFERYVKKLLTSNVQLRNSRSNEYLCSNKEYEQPICLDININMITYVYFTKYNENINSLLNVIWDKNVANIIHVKIKTNENNLVPSNLGSFIIDAFNLQLKKYKKTSNFTTKYFNIFKSTDDIRDMTFYELYWHSYQYPLDMIMLQIHLLTNVNDSRPHLIYCTDQNKCHLTILCHACLRDTKERQKLSPADTVKLLSSTKDLFNNNLTYNNSLKRLFIMLLDCIKMKDTKMNVNEKFDFYTLMKIKAGLRDEMNYLNSVTRFDKMMLELSEQTLKKIIFKHELCIEDQRFMLTAIPAPSNFDLYFKDILNNNVNILLAFDYKLIEKKSDDLEITLHKINENAICEIYSCEFQCSPNFAITTNAMKTIKFVNIKCFNYNNPAKVLEICEIIDSYISQNVNTVHITCKDGIRISGLYIALIMIKKQIHFELTCDIVSVVRQLRCLSEHYFKTEKEYKYLYELAVKYVSSTSHYTYLV